MTAPPSGTIRGKPPSLNSPMRKNQKPWKPPITPQEIYLKRQLEKAGYEVLTCQRIAGYWPDLIIAGTSLIIEVDGDYHNTKEQKEKDFIRSAILLEEGWTVLRLKNKVAMNRKVAIKRLEEALKRLERADQE